MREVRIRQRVDEPEMVWTGRLDFDLVDMRDGWRYGRIELVIRLDLITVWWDERTLAVLDRDRFRRWLRRPHSVDYWHDDITFYRQGANSLAFRIGIGPRHAIPDDITTQLLAVV